MLHTLTLLGCLSDTPDSIAYGIVYPISLKSKVISFQRLFITEEHYVLEKILGLRSLDSATTVACYLPVCPFPSLILQQVMLGVAV